MQIRNMVSNLPNLVLSDNKGDIFNHPDFKMLGMANESLRLPQEEELIPLPKGSSLFYMPGYAARGFDPENNSDVTIIEFRGKKVYPVGAFIIPGYTRVLLPAANKIDKKIILPLWSYTAVGWAKGRFWVAGIKIDKRSRQRPHYYEDMNLLKKNISLIVEAYPKNRLYKHLANCALNYNCRAAQNLYFSRWEAPLPTSPSCNANCLGCLSFQDSDCTSASHGRINFVPTPLEISQVAVNHFLNAKEAIASFGQGCEGEPLLQFGTIKNSIKNIREAVSYGTIHLNTNAYNPGYLKELAKVGLDSVRISINSFQNDFYNAYYRPRGYGLKDVLKSMEVSKKSGLFVSLNLLVFPGLTDTEAEIKILINLLRRGYVDLLQLRNLCIDQDYYIKNMPVVRQKAVGILNMIKLIQKAVPKIRFGYFNLPKEKF